MTDEDTAPEPPLKEQILAQMGGWTGMVYSSLPVVAFVPANALWGLEWGSVAAIGVAAVILVIRLATRSSVQPAVSGFVGVGMCVLIALAVGSGKGFFLYGIVVQAVLLVAFVVSVVIRRPLVGVLWNSLDLGGPRHVDQHWRSVRRELWTFDALTVLWAAMFGVRFVVQGLLYTQGRTGWLGVARIAMGWPLFGLCLLATYGGARWAVATVTDTSVAGEIDTQHGDGPDSDPLTRDEGDRQ